MVSDERIMRRLFRTTAFARRRYFPKGGDGELPGIAPIKKGFSEILGMLVTEDGVSQQQIADRIGIRPQSASEAISSMETHGLIRREESEEDKRITLIYITDIGREYYEKSSRELARQAGEFLSVLNDEEKQVLFSLLMKLGRAEERTRNAPDKGREESKCHREE